MSHGYEATVLADSISPDGVRLVTLKTVYPRFIHSEMLRHRVFSHSVASSRAIPPERIIAEVEEYGVVPEFNARVRGMGVGDVLASSQAEIAERAWLDAKDAAATSAKRLIELGVDKSRVNRLLEPFMWLTDIITATEWSNFFALRQPSGDGPVPDQSFPAQPEFQIIARMMRDAMDTSSPLALDIDEWHMPMLTPDELPEAFAECGQTHQWEEWKMVSAGRIARVSFDKHDEQEPRERSVERARKLLDSGHLSPFEHVACPSWVPLFCGNFRGWDQMRKDIDNEHDRSLMIRERPEIEAL